MRTARLAFVGSSHAAQHLSAAAEKKGFKLAWPQDADVVFVSEDTPTTGDGIRDLELIRSLVCSARNATQAPMVLTSAVPPGFTRALGIPKIIHQAETLRMRDAMERALHPERIIVGTQNPNDRLPSAYSDYLEAFRCPVLRMTWEEAEFSKVAVNVFLAAQVDITNQLASASASVGADWNKVKEVLKSDGRIGQRAYVEPGRWQDSSHLVRDYRTLQEIVTSRRPEELVH